MWIFGGDPIGHAAWLLSMFGNSDLSLGPLFCGYYRLTQVIWLLEYWEYTVLDEFLVQGQHKLSCYH